MAFQQIPLNPQDPQPIYRQLADGIRRLVENGAIQSGDKLPATRELAGLLKLNRTTVSAAYSILDQAGLLEGHVGRGSFIAPGVAAASATPTAAWDQVLPPLERAAASPPSTIEISFSSSRPAQSAFPLEALQQSVAEVMASADCAQIFQLGAPHGYQPLRRYLLEAARAAGIARPLDEVIVTNGCQQALDLLARLFFSTGSPGAVAIEDPVYHGLIRVLARSGAAIHPVKTGAHGIDLDALEITLRAHRPRLLIVTPSYQNPTGATMPIEQRQRLIELVRRYGTVLVENDIYSELRYQGEALPTLKELDSTGNTILLRSYSKVSFPGLRVGWVIAPRPVIASLAEAKQITDLHSDQLSQAVLLRFAQSGRLREHLEQTRRAGAERLSVMLSACGRYLPRGVSFTRPAGGMSLWVELPPPLSAESLLQQAAARGVDFLSGHYFSAQQAHPHGLRLSFGGLTPEEIERGIRILGEAAQSALGLYQQINHAQEPLAALV